MDQDSNAQRFIAWLTFHPSLEKIARALVLDYLSRFNPIQAMIYSLEKDDSVVCKASYGNANVTTGASTPSLSWRGWLKVSAPELRTSPNKALYISSDGMHVVINLCAQGMLIGFLQLRFADPIHMVEDFTLEALNLTNSLSLYISIQFLGKIEEVDLSLDIARANGKIQVQEARFTDRQQLILAGIINKHTNNEIARAMGYSVSTIRHEIMRIFEALGVSDRGEAAQKAVALGLPLDIKE